MPAKPHVIDEDRRLFRAYDASLAVNQLRGALLIERALGAGVSDSRH
jgi:hypothetical protein